MMTLQSDPESPLMKMMKSRNKIDYEYERPEWMDDKLFPVKMKFGDGLPKGVVFAIYHAEYGNLLVRSDGDGWSTVLGLDVPCRHRNEGKEDDV